jgi:F420-non-reducing hydrogenase iron-sulfur subunit
MVVETRPTPLKILEESSVKVQITVFHCFNALQDVSLMDGEGVEINSVKMPCSSITREIVLLKAFEAGADAVVVLVCPEGSCRYLEGNLRAQKRVARVKKILDDTGIDGRRLNIFNINSGDQSAANSIIKQTLMDLNTLGPNPAK